MLCGLVKPSGASASIFGLDVATQGDAERCGRIGYIWNGDLIAATAIGAALSGGGSPIIDVRPRVLFNPGLQSANFLVPGLIGVIMQLITMFLTTLSIVGERERGTLDQIDDAGFCAADCVKYSLCAQH